jgi:hypothetical protein
MGLDNGNACGYTSVPCLPRGLDRDVNLCDYLFFMEP